MKSVQIALMLSVVLLQPKIPKERVFQITQISFTNHTIVCGPDAGVLYVDPHGTAYPPNLRLFETITLFPQTQFCVNT